MSSTGELFNSHGTFNKNSIWVDSITNESTFKSPQSSSSSISIFQVDTQHITTQEISSIQISSIQISSTHVTPVTRISSTQISSTQVSPTQIDFTQVSSAQVNVPKINSTQLSSTQINPTKISFPSSISLQQLLSSYPHLYTSASTNTYQNNLQTLLDPTFNLSLEITDLPTGQLAEAVVTQFDQYGRPNGGTILIDHNANGLGWFIDPTPLDNSEFTQTLTDTAFHATPDSPAHGKYDLLTTILHETAHFLSIINGNPGFDQHIQTINGKPTFIGENFTATLTPDRSHFDSTVHPYDLMNTSLRPGVRKLPSLLNLQIINAIRTRDEEMRRWGDEGNTLQAPLTSAPLTAILNGEFDTPDNWQTRGATTINQQATLTEQSLLNSHLSQTFIIPEQAKYLQFTLTNTNLNPSNNAPGDAFEVALLNTNTSTPLAGIPTFLTQTDALLNIQHDGTAYFSDKVNLGTTTSGDTINTTSPRTVTVDISHIAPGTEATLYFDLLGFGSQESSVSIDNVRILTDDILPPIANNDIVSANQAQPVIINILDNDSDADGTINPNTVTIDANPLHGNIAINDNGTITYTPNSDYIGADTFTYSVQDNEGNTSNIATVNITVNNTAPSINEIAIETNISVKRKKAEIIGSSAIPNGRG